MTTTAPANGRPPRLHDQRVQDAIVGALAAGNNLKVAASAADVGERTLIRYLARGAAANATLQRLLDEHPDTIEDDEIAAELLPEGERLYWHFWRAIERARDRSQRERILRIREAGAGVEEVESVTVTERDAAGAVIKTTTTEKRTVKRDWKADAWHLERTLPHLYGRSTRVDLTASVAIEAPEDVEAKRLRALQLRDDLVAKRQQRRIEAAPDPDDAIDVASSVVDAETLETWQPDPTLGEWWPPMNGGTNGHTPE